MIVTFKDQETGLTAKSDYPFSIYWWAEGNGSCNCNRQQLFGIEGLSCYDEFGRIRFLAIDVEDCEELTIEKALKDENDGLDEKYQLKTKDDIIKAINEGIY